MTFLKQFAWPACAAAFGVFVGVALSGTQLRSTSDRLLTKEIVLVGARGVPAARLRQLDGQTRLEFYGEGSDPAIVLGVDHKNPASFLHFLGKGGEVLAALNTLSNEDTTLYLGDRRWGTRVIMGSLSSDVPPMPDNPPSSEWGLVFRKPGGGGPIFDVLVKAPSNSKEATASFGLLRANGKSFSVY